jgi:hypothetical protein
MSKHIRLISFLCLVALLAACGPQAQQYSGAPLAWIDSPLDGFVLPLAPVDVMSHAADPTGIARFELSVDGGVISTDPSPDTAAAIVTIHQAWIPTAPGVYTLKVRAMNPAGIWSDYAVAVVTIVGESPPDQPGSAQATPTLAASQPRGTVTINAVCRAGPNMNYAILLYLASGETVDINGQNGNWWQIVRPDGYGNCWVSGSVITVVGDTNNVPVMDVPLPTVLPTDVPQGCYVYNAQQQAVCVVPCPANAVPGGVCTP